MGWNDGGQGPYLYTRPELSGTGAGGDPSEDFYVVSGCGSAPEFFRKGAGRIVRRSSRLGFAKCPASPDADVEGVEIP
ncbi:hypothetical protein NL676_030828 [Syzygium grande]|nr:hypothetical protein NL676_030828 [Syzygium grande]